MSKYSFIKQALKPDSVFNVSERKEFAAKFRRFMEASDRLEKVEKERKSSAGDFNRRVHDSTGTLEKGQKAIQEYETSRKELADFIKTLKNAKQFVSDRASELVSYSIKSTVLAPIFAGIVWATISGGSLAVPLLTGASLAESWQFSAGSAAMAALFFWLAARTAGNSGRAEKAASKLYKSFPTT